MAVRPQDELITNIQTELADNNAGSISAYDVRHNMEDVVDSLLPIVASGDFNSNPFVGNNVRIGQNDEDLYGVLIVESGIIFDNGTGNEALVQVQPFLGAGGINHGDLGDLGTGDPHTQYINVNGIRTMDRNLGLGDAWINASGASDGAPATYDDRGLQFQYKDANVEEMHVGNKTVIKTDIDGSSMTSCVQTAQAYIRFVGSGDMSVVDSHNVVELERINDPGRYKVYFKPGLFDNGNYVCVGNSNGTGDDASAEDMDVVNVGIVERTADYVTFAVQNANGAYVNAAVNDLVIYGRASGVISNESVTITT